MPKNGSRQVLVVICERPFLSANHPNERDEGPVTASEKTSSCRRRLGEVLPFEGGHAYCWESGGSSMWAE